MVKGEQVELSDENEVHHALQQCSDNVFAGNQRLYQSHAHSQDLADQAFLGQDVYFFEILGSLRGKDPVQHLQQQNHTHPALRLLFVLSHCLALYGTVAYELEENVMVVGPVCLEPVLLEEEVGGFDLIEV